jgi:multiple sugar transport system substrate-binding protein
MKELNFTILSHFESPTPAMLSVMEDFEAEYNIHVNLKLISWTIARSELVNYALFKEPPDVSEVGSTWVGGFWAMNALRQFSADENRKMGAPSAFLKVAWDSCVTYRGRVYGIPWSVDLRNILYRKDHFQKAGIDETTAFRDVPSMQAAWQKLLDRRYRIPWAIPSQGTLTVLHYVASWVWENGGRFFSEDGSELRFNEAKSKEGIYRYYMDQAPYLPARAQNITDADGGALFRKGEASILPAAYWVLEAINQGDASSKVIKNLGVAALPLPTFVGGTNLVIWRDSRRVEDAVKLVNYLTSHKVQIGTQSSFSVLPARTESLEQSLVITNPEHYPVILQSLERGRTFSAPYMWGMVESRLLPVYVSIWQDLFANPNIDLRSIIDQRIDDIASRLSEELTT